MKYSFNYAYLQNVRRQLGMDKTQMFEMLDSCKDYVTLNKWLDGKVPVNVQSLISFCNKVKVPLECFFVDEDSPLTAKELGAMTEEASVETWEWSFNKMFLRTFLRQHNLMGKDLLTALGTSSYPSLEKWLNGDIPQSPCTLLRFCNYYQLPLGVFFLRDGLPVTLNPVNLPDAQKLPTGYLPQENHRRGHRVKESLLAESYSPSQKQQKVIEVLTLEREAYYTRQQRMLPAADVSSQPADETSPMYVVEEMKNVQTRVPMSVYAKLNRMKYFCGEQTTIGELCARAIVEDVERREALIAQAIR